jgi:ABC-type multidrug transport system fused ATPase/permease subunit
MLKILQKFRAILDRRSKLYLIIIVLSALFASVVEVAGIAAIMPFVAASTNPDYIHTNEILQWLYAEYCFKSTLEFVLFFGVALILFYIFRLIVSTVYSYMLARFAYGRYHYFAFKFFSSYVESTYQDLGKNEKNCSQLIEESAKGLSSVLLSSIVLIYESLVVLGLSIILIMIHWKMTIVLGILLIIKNSIFSKLISEKLTHESQKLILFKDKFLKVLNDSISNLKLIKLYSADKKVIEDFEKSSSEHARVNISNFALKQLARSGMESVAIIVAIATIIYIILKAPNASHIIPIMTMFAMALYRMLPSIEKMYKDVNKYRENTDENIVFDRDIRLDKVTFGYSDKWSILFNLNLNIKKGQKVAIMGNAGSGKATLIELISGIYTPKSGTVYIDNVALEPRYISSWRQKIGYASKPTHLFDANARENVVLDAVYDSKRVEHILHQVQISDFLESRQGVNTQVGESGVKLSGGQKFKLGLARALYDMPDIIIIDEIEDDSISDGDIKLLESLFFSDPNEMTIIFAINSEEIANRCDVAYKMDKGMIYKLKKEQGEEIQ